MSTELHDPITGETFHWHSLERTRSITPPKLGRGAVSKLAALGTCGDVSSPTYRSWRTEELFPTLAGTYAIQEAQVFNPEVRHWTPERARVEGFMLARAPVVVAPVLNSTGGPASILDASFAALGGALRGQDVGIFIEDNEQSPRETRQARLLANLILSRLASNLPFFTHAQNLDQLIHFAGSRFVDYQQREASGLTREITYKSSIENQLQTKTPYIFVSGSSGKQKLPWMHDLSRRISEYDSAIPVIDSHNDNWGADPHAAAQAELEHKLGAGVQLIAITNDSPSIGALGELGARLLHAHFAKQSVGLYLEPHDSQPNTPSNRSRTLAREHIRGLLKDFPDLDIFVAKSMGQLATFGVSEFLKLQQRHAFINER